MRVQGYECKQGSEYDKWWQFKLNEENEDTRKKKDSEKEVESLDCESSWRRRIVET